MEAAYTGQGIAAAKTCTQGTKIDYDALETCFKGKEGDLAQMREAKQTFDHPGTPDVRIAGKPLLDRTAKGMIAAICTAYWEYTGTKPAGCSSEPVDGSPVSAIVV